MNRIFSAVPAWIWLAVAIVIVVALVVLLIVLIRRRRASLPRLPEGVEDMPARVRQVFAAAEGSLRARAADRAAAWIAGPTQPAPGTGRRLLMLGPVGAGKTTLLSQLAQGSTFAPALAATSGSPCNLFRLDGTIAVEVAGRVLRDEDAKGGPGDAFRAVFAELQRAFPDRPVDGVVLTLPLSRCAPDAPRDKIAEEARQLRKRLDDVRRELAMEVPVYLVLTQCDELPSFSALGRQVGEARRQRVLGWSRAALGPAGPGDDLVEEAMGRVSAAITDEQRRRFAADPPIADAHDYFLFPSDLEARADALRAWVDPIFHDRAQGAPPDLRGIYFTGRGAPAPAIGPDGALAPAVSAPILFSWDLFHRKILAESNLARPSPDAEKKRVRVIRALQILAAVVLVVWGAVLFATSGSLERAVASLVPYLRELDGDLVQIAGGDRRTAKYAAHLLDRQAEIGTNRLRSYAVPTSFLSSIDGRLEEAIALGYEEVIFRAFLQTMEEAGAVRPEPLPALDDAALAAATVDRTPEFERADEWLRRLEAFSADADRYEQIYKANESRPSEQTIKAIADLSDSLLRHKLDASFFSNSAYYTSPISRPMPTLRRFDVTAMVPVAQDDAKKVFQELHQRIYVLNSGPVVPDDLEELLTSFRELEDPASPYTTKQFRRLQRAIKNMEEHVGRDGLKWIPGDQLPATPAKQEALFKRVSDLRVLLGPELADRLRADARERLLKLQDSLRAAKDPLLGPVLSRKEGGERLEMKLAAQILALSEPIEAIARQPYMAGEEDRSGVRELPVEIRIPTESWVEWDVDALKGLAKILKDYETMLTDGPFDRFPRAVQPKVHELVRRRVQVWLHGQIMTRASRRVDSVSAGSVPFHVLHADAQNFALAGAPLREIIGSLGRARLDESRDQLRAAVRGQGARVLRGGSRNLESENLYRASFGFWNGDGTPAYRAFQVADGVQLAEHVVDQRTRAETLAREVAQPVLLVMVSPEVGTVDAPEVGPWDRLVTALRDYEAKKAGNSLAALERLILSELPAVTDLDKCLAMEKLTARGRDFFGERRRQIHEALRERCHSISRDDLRDWYERLRLEFNRSLADRFPFSKNDRADDASPEAVRAFLRGAGDLRRRYRGVLAEHKDSSSKDVVRFLDRIEEVSQFLAPLWPQSESADGAYEVRVEFRANPARELGGNQIAEWSLRLAEERLTHGGPKSSARWHLDDPVRVQLRWAKNSPDMPSSSQAPRVIVGDRVVTWEERGLWALLRLVFSHQSNLRDEESRTEGSNLLVFNVRTLPDPQGGFLDRPGTDSGTARVFIRLTLAGGGKDKPTARRFPEFPTRAPVYLDALEKAR